MVVPREHGAWGMMLVPLATAAVAALYSGINAGALILFVLAALSLFWLRTPVESWLGTSAIKAHSAEERRHVLRAAIAIGAISLVCVATLLWNGRNRDLLLIGAVAALAFAAQAVVKKLGRRGRMPAQIIGAIGLTSTAAGAYYVAAGHLNRTAAALWLANWLFAADQIHFVQLRIRSARTNTFQQKLSQGRVFLLLQAALIGVVVAACHFGLLPVAATVAFIPVLLRGIFWFVRRQPPLDVHQLGFAELRLALAFGALLAVAFLP